MINISENRISEIVRSVINKVLSEGRNVLDNGNLVEVDNFDIMPQLLDFSDPDNVYYLMLVKRHKDNPGMHTNIEYKRYYLIHDLQELESHEREIKALCIRDRLRAYITANKRSLSTGNMWVSRYKSNPKKYRGMWGIETQMAFGRSFEDGLNRDVIMIDVDTSDKSVHDEVRKILAKHNVKILTEYSSLNDGLHIFTRSQEEIIDAYLANEFIKFDGGKDLGKLATVGMDVDKYALLYCCLEPKGYRSASSYNPHFQAKSASDAIEYRKKMQARKDKLAAIRNIKNSGNDEKV